MFDSKKYHREYMRKYNQDSEHKRKARESTKKWSESNKGKEYLEKYHKLPHVKERARLYWRSDRGKINKRLYWRSVRELVVKHYGGKCACCGEDKYEFLAIDHVNGGGHKHRNLIKKHELYKWLRQNNFPEGFRILCHNCNQSLGAYGYCPHNK